MTDTFKIYSRGEEIERVVSGWAAYEVEKRAIRGEREQPLVTDLPVYKILARMIKKLADVLKRRELNDIAMFTNGLYNEYTPIIVHIPAPPYTPQIVAQICADLQSKFHLIAQPVLEKRSLEQWEKYYIQVATWLEYAIRHISPGTHAQV